MGDIRDHAKLQRTAQGKLAEIGQSRRCVMRTADAGLSLPQRRKDPHAHIIQLIHTLRVMIQHPRVFYSEQERDPVRAFGADGGQSDGAASDGRVALQVAHCFLQTQPAVRIGQSGIGEQRHDLDVLGKSGCFFQRHGKPIVGDGLTLFQHPERGVAMQIKQ